MQQAREKLPQLSASDLAAQRAAHSALRRQMRVVLVGLAASVVSASAIQFFLPNGIPGSCALGIPLAALAMLLLVYRLQWKVLITYQLHCPNCSAYLAASPRVFSSPTPHCPQCGKLALLPSKYLADHN